MVGIKENFLRVFTWLIFLPCMSALAWYGLYKLIRWLFGGQKEIKKRYNSGGCEMGICQGYNVVGFRVFILSLCYNGLGFMKLGIENQTINEIGKLLVIALSYLFSNGLYYVSFMLNRALRYLLESVGYKPKTIDYPKQKEDEDILGI